MAKKARKTPPKRKKKKTTKHNAVFFASVKQMLLWAIILFIGFIGLLFLYNYFYPDPEWEASVDLKYWFLK